MKTIRCNYFGSRYIDGSEIFRSAFFAIFVSYGSVFGHFFSVRWAIVGHFCPNIYGVVKNDIKENLLLHQKWAFNSNFCEPNFQEFCLKWWRKELFLHCGDELSDCNCGGIFLMDKPFLKLGHYSSKAYWRGPLKFSKSGREIIARIQYQMQSETQFFTNRNVIINPSIHFQIFFSVLK